MFHPRAVTGDYNGAPVITIYTGEKYQGKDISVTLGLKKAKAVEMCIRQIREFIDHNSNIGVRK